MKKLLISAIFAVLTVSFAGTASAATWTFIGGINNSQSEATHALVGSVGFGGGVVTATLDDVSGIFDWEVSFAGLTDLATAAHFHGPAAPGFTAGVLLAAPGIAGHDAGIFSGSDIMGAPGIAALTGGMTLLAGDVTDVYFNVHTPLNGPGEIRGQLFVDSSPVPVPAAAWLLISGIAGVFGLRRGAA